MMKQPIKDCCYNNGIVEQFSPIAKCLIGRNNRAGFFIPVCNKSEEQIAFLPGDGGIVPDPVPYSLVKSITCQSFGQSRLEEYIFLHDLATTISKGGKNGKKTT